MRLNDDQIDELLGLLDAKHKSENRIVSRYTQIRFVYWAVSTTVACVVGVTLWVGKVQFDVKNLYDQSNDNRRLVRQLYRNDYGFEP